MNTWSSSTQRGGGQGLPESYEKVGSTWVGAEQPSMKVVTVQLRGGKGIGGIKSRVSKKIASKVFSSV